MKIAKCSVNIYLFYVCVKRNPRKVTYKVPLQVCCAHASRVEILKTLVELSCFIFDVRKKSLVLAILGLFV